MMGLTPIFKPDSHLFFPVRKVISPYHRGNKGLFIKKKLKSSFRRGYQRVRHARETGLSDRGLEYSELCIRSAGGV